ncbi:phage protein D [Leptolyngbya sp. PCC 7375]|nr:phage protein D [Leptolyngbya sp. PCC 7375]
MQPISYKVTLASTTHTSNLLSLSSHTSLLTPTHRCHITLSTATVLSLSLKVPVTVALGYNNTTTPIFTGTTHTINYGIDHITIEALSTFRTLTTTHLNLLYEKPTAGDIVKNIAQSRLNLKTAKIENGLTFPTYTIGDQQSTYDQLAHLAHQCNFDLYADTDDKLVFAKYNPTTTHTLTYGNNILNYHQAQPAPGITAVEVYGESPASQGQGDQAHSWLTKKDVKGTAGGGTGTKLRIADPTARTQAVANKVAQALLAQKQQKQRGQVRVLGDPNIKLGDAIKIEKMPQAQHNGTFKITGVAHHLSRRKGFYTTIDWEQT